MVEFWNNGIQALRSAFQWYILLLLLVVYTLWGLSSVILAWTHEVASGKGKQKSYYIYLNKRLRKGLDVSTDNFTKKKWSSPESISLSNFQVDTLPSFKNGSRCLCWNYTFLASIIFLSSIILISNYGGYWWIVLAELCTLFFSVGIIGPTQLIRNFNKVWLLTVLCIMVGKSLAFAFFTNYYLFYIYIALTQTIFIISYFFLRYYFDPGFDFSELFRKPANKMSSPKLSLTEKICQGEKGIAKSATHCWLF